MGIKEGAEVGYNPHKPGRPSHTYHTYFIGNLRLALDVEVRSGTQTAAAHTRPGLWAFLHRLPPRNASGLSAGRLCVWH